MLLTLLLALAPVQDTTHLVVAATTDVHGRALAWDYLRDRPFPGGLARAAAAVDSLRREYPGRVLLVDAGDLLQGNPFADYFARVAPKDPNPIIDAMNVMGYDVATPGNHEFDYGVDAMLRSLSGAAFPYVSANIRNLPDDRLMFSQMEVIPRAGVRVGVTGLVTPGVMRWNRHRVSGRARVERIESAAPPALERLAATDLSIVLIHSGMAGLSSYDTAGVGAEDAAASLAAMPDPPDLVIVGHSHREMVDSVINGVHFIQPRPYAQSLALAHVTLVRPAGGNWRVVAIRGEQLPLAGVGPDPRIDRRLRDDHLAVDRWVATPLGAAAAPMPSRYARVRPNAVTGFINHVQRQRTGAQLSATAAFSVDAGFRGAIRMADLAAIYPYENVLRAVRISGGQLKEYLEYNSRYYLIRDGRVTLNDSVPGYNFDVLSGVDYTIDLTMPVGRRITRLEFAGRPVVSSDTFTLALNSYRQAGGGGFAMLAGTRVVYDRGESVRDVLIEEVRRAGTLDPADFVADNWRLEPEHAAEAAAALFSASDRERFATPLVRILAVGGLRGELAADPARAVPGIAGMKVTVDSLAAACDCPSLVVSVGDNLKGTPLSDVDGGRLAAWTLGELGVAAAGLGRAEAMLALDSVQALINQTSLPLVSSNTFGFGSTSRLLWLPSVHTVELAGSRVTIIGYTDPAVYQGARSDQADRLDVRQAGEQLANRLADLAAAEAPDVTVLLWQGCSPDCPGREAMLHRLRQTGLDLLVELHPGGDVTDSLPRLHPEPLGRTVAVADIYPDGTVVTGSYRAVPREDTDPALDSLLAGRMAEVADQGAEFVSRVRLPLARGTGDYQLGRLVADAARNGSRADIALVSDSMIRHPLDNGRVTVLDIYRVLPEGHQLVTLELTGREVLNLLEAALASPDGVHLSGIRVEIDPARSAGDRVRQVTLTDGRNLSDGDRYTVVVPEYLTGRTSSWGVLSSAARVAPPMLDREALARYLRRLPQPVEGPRDARVVER